VRDPGDEDLAVDTMKTVLKGGRVAVGIMKVNAVMTKKVPVPDLVVVVTPRSRVMTMPTMGAVQMLMRMGY